MNTIKATDKDIARFMSKVDILPNGCWFWTGGRSRGGGNKKWYGSFSVNGKTIRAHRFSCEVLNGLPPLPQGYDRAHICDFSLCVSPEHVVYLSKEENQEQRLKRIRCRSSNQEEDSLLV